MGFVSAVGTFDVSLTHMTSMYIIYVCMYVCMYAGMYKYMYTYHNLLPITLDPIIPTINAISFLYIII